MIPNRQCAEPDYNLLSVALEDAGLSKKTDRAEAAANALLIKDWEHVERIAAVAFKNHGLSFLEIHDLMGDI